jgi:hypothetical protein
MALALLQAHGKWTRSSGASGCAEKAEGRLQWWGAQQGGQEGGAPLRRVSPGLQGGGGAAPPRPRPPPQACLRLPALSFQGPGFRFFSTLSQVFQVNTLMLFRITHGGTQNYSVKLAENPRFFSSGFWIQFNADPDPAFFLTVIRIQVSYHPGLSFSKDSSCQLTVSFHEKKCKKGISTII